MTHDITQDIRGGMDALLQDLVLDSADLGAFLPGLAALSAAALSDRQHEVSCGLIVTRRKKPVIVAGSDPRPQVMGEQENILGAGPCLDALRDPGTVLVPYIQHERRWPGYGRAAAGQGIGSVLAVPVAMDGGTGAAFGLYSDQPNAFTGADIATAEGFAGHASRSLRLALRIAHLTDARNDLTQAMKSRTTIDTALGVVMAQNRCSQETAYRVLTRASNSRNIKLRDLAASVIAAISGENKITTYFDE